jgi:hypothetical protein
MPGGFPLLADVCNGQALGTAPAAPSPTQGYGTTLTSGATNNSKGAWVELTPALAADCCLLEIEITHQSLGGVIAQAIDIGIGPAGGEQVIIGDLYSSPGFNVIANGLIALPIHIPAGARIAARCAASSASKTVNVMVRTWDGEFAQGDGCVGATALGFTAASTAGTLITPSATANTMGAVFTPLIATTARDYSGIFAMVAGISNNRQSWLIDFAIGGSGSEQVIIPQRRFYYGDVTNSISGLSGMFLVPFIPIKIPAGSRLSARCQSSIASGQALPIVAYGVF